MRHKIRNIKPVTLNHSCLPVNSHEEKTKELEFTGDNTSRSPVMKKTIGSGGKKHELDR